MYEPVSLAIRSRLLAGNAGGDPSRRTLVVLAPAGHDRSIALPVVWMFPGHGSSQGGFLAGDPWKESLPQRLARLVAGGMPPILVALPDLFTRYGGSQSLDSAATGPYESHLWQELRPLLEAHFRVTAHGVAGHSSGGYGALVNAMRHPDIVRACACHAGDMLFEYCYLPDFPKAAAKLRAEGGPERFMTAFETAQQRGPFMSAINILAMAACYSPLGGAPLGFELPFDPETAELRPDVWQRWLANDPVRLVEDPAHRAALSKLALLFVDAGSRDEFNLAWGARALVRRLRAHGVPHTYEEFDDGHMGTSYRFDRSLPLLARALSG